MDGLSGKKDYKGTAKNILGNVNLDKAIEGFKRIHIEGNRLTDVLKKCGYEESEITEKLQVLGTSGTKLTEKLSGAFAGLAGKLGMSTKALSIFGGAVAGISLAFAAWKLYESYVQGLVDAAREAGTAWEESSKTLDSQVEKIEGLKKALDSGMLSEQETYEVKSELYEIQKSLIEAYGKEAEGLDLVNGKYQEQIQLVKNLDAAKASGFLNENKKGIDKATSEMEMERDLTIAHVGYTSASDSQLISDILSKYSDFISRDNTTGGGISGGSTTAKIVFTGDATQAKEVLNSLMNDLRAAEDDFESSSLYDNLMNGISKQLNVADDILQNYQAIYEQAKLAEVAADTNKYSYGGSDKTASLWLSEYANAIENYNDALESGDTTKISDAKAEYDRLNEAITALVAGPMGKYSIQVGDIAGKLDSAAIAQKNFVDGLAAGSYASAYANHLKNSGLTDIDLMTANLTQGVQAGEGALNVLIRAAREAGMEVGDTTEDIERFIAMLVNAGYVASSSIENIADPFEALTDFDKFSDYIDKTTDSLTTLANAQNLAKNGFKVTIEQAMELAKVYPEILKNATVSSDGQIKLNKEIANAFIDGKRTEINAAIDTEIAKLQAEKESLTGQMNVAKAELELVKSVAEGSAEITAEELSYKINARNALTDAIIQMGVEEAEANALATAAMAENQEEFTRVAAICAQKYGINFDNASYNAAVTFINNSAAMKSELAAITAQAHQAAAAMAGVSSGVQAGSTDIVQGNASVTAGGPITLDLYDGSFNGSEYTYEHKQVNIDDYISQIELDISSYQDAIAQVDAQIAVLESLRNTSLSKFMDAGSSGSSEASDAKDVVEEYTATIEQYNTALQKLEDAQRERLSLEKKLEHTSDLSDKIFVSGNLIDAYGAEAAAEKNLLEAKKKTVKMNVSALKNLGFDVEYNDETNRLYIKNLEHLNELTADSAGEYDSLQEATNALRQETEELIDTTKQLNSENSDTAENIEDLTYKILEAKDNIISYIGEIYQTQIDAYQKIVDERKKLIESAKDELDYEDQIKEKVEEIADLQSRIDLLSLDDSRSAQAEVEALKQELMDKQKELSNLQNDHATDMRLEALDKMAEDYEAEKNEDLDALRGTVEMSSDLWNAFYQTLQGQTVDLGESISTEIADAWLAAAEAVRQYQGVVDGVSSLDTTPIDSLPEYHTGGVVGKSDVEDNETIAVLENGEVVLDKAKQDTLQEIIAAQDKMAEILFGSRGEKHFNRHPMKNEGRELPYGDHIINNNQTYTFEPHIDVTIHHSGSVEDNVASAFGNKIADAAIDSLYSAFERRGMSAVKGARLRP